jgi:hypothetical protein
VAFENDPEGREISVHFAGDDFDKPQEIKVEVFGQWMDEEWQLSEFLNLINGAVESIPLERRSSARVELGGETCPHLEIWYTGIETEAMVAARVGRCVKHVADLRASERATFERLKAKFGT